jgi:predicted amidohydrolase YtcJ
MPPSANTNSPTATPRQSADRMLRGGRIYTLNPRQPWAEALGTSGNRISFVGSNTEAERYIGPATEVTDLAGQFVMPGFNDAHIHFAPHMLPLLGECGITTAQTISEVADIPEYVRLAKEGLLTTRLEVRLPLESWKDFPVYRAMAEETNGMVRVIGLKAYADGMFRHRTAFLLGPYDGSISERGALSKMAADLALFDQLLDGAVSVGADVSTHAIGDAGVRFVLDHYERLIIRHRLEDHRLRVIHASLVSPADFARFGNLRMIAEVNPYHAEAIPWLEPIVGDARTRWAFAFRSLKSNGAMLCFGSDYPGPTGQPEFPLHPLLGIQAAVLHPHPDERLTLEEALAAYTVAPAIATRTYSENGTLEVGKLADVIVLTANPFEREPEQIGAIQLKFTVFNGLTLSLRSM